MAGLGYSVLPHVPFIWLRRSGKRLRSFTLSFRGAFSVLSVVEDIAAVTDFWIARKVVGREKKEGFSYKWMNWGLQHGWEY